MSSYSSNEPQHPRWFQGSRPPTETDEDLALRVADRLRTVLPAPGYFIVVEVQNGVVMLEGIVPTVSVRAQAHRIAWRVAGVSDVSNRLSVGHERDSHRSRGAP